MARSPSRLAAAPTLGTPWVAPAAVAAGALAGCAVLVAADPGVPGRYGVCPFLAVTGRWCPLCGSLRAVHHLLTGAPTAALSSNALTVLALPVVVFLWAAWLGSRTGRWRLPTPTWTPDRVGIAATVVVLFGVVRNMSAFGVLAP